MNYKIIYSGENSLLGIRKGYSFLQVDQGEITESEDLIEVVHADGLKNVYFVMDDNLIPGPKGILAEDNENRGVVEENFYFYRLGFDYHLFQISTRKDYLLGSYCSYGVFYQETPDGVKICYINENNEVPELPFISLDIKEAADGVHYQFIALADGKFKIVRCDYDEEDEDNDFDDESYPCIEEIEESVLIVPQEGMASVYYFDPDRKVYRVESESDVLSCFDNAVITGTKSYAKLYGYEEDVKKLVAEGRIESLDDYEVVISGKKFTSRYGHSLNLEPVKEVEAVGGYSNIEIVTVRAEPVQETPVMEPKQEKVTYFSAQAETEVKTKSLWDYVLPWRWFN